MKFEISEEWLGHKITILGDTSDAVTIGPFPIVFGDLEEKAKALIAGNENEAGELHLKDTYEPQPISCENEALGDDEIGAQIRAVIHSYLQDINRTYKTLISPVSVPIKIRVNND